MSGVFRFSTKRLLLVVTALGIAMGLIAYQNTLVRMRCKRQKEFVNKLKMGGSVVWIGYLTQDGDRTTDSKPQGWIRKWILGETAKPIHSIEIQGGSVPDSVWEELSTFPSVKSLSLLATDSTDETMAIIAKADQLVELHLNELEITDKGLSNLDKLRHLEGLSLYQMGSIDGPGNINGTGYQFLENLNALRHIDMYSTENSSMAVQFLGNKPDLQEVHLGYGTLQPQDIDVLANLPRLEKLILVDCNMNEGLLPKLSIQKNLKYLSCPSETTQATLTLLKKQLPQCTVR